MLWYFGGGSMIFWTGMNHEHTPTRVKGPFIPSVQGPSMEFSRYVLHYQHRDHVWIAWITSILDHASHVKLPSSSKTTSHGLQPSTWWATSVQEFVWSDFCWIFSRNTENKSRWASLSICKDSSPSIQQPKQIKDRSDCWVCKSWRSNIRSLIWILLDVFSEMEDGGGRHTKTQRFGVFICRWQTAEIEKILWKIFVCLGSSKVLQIKKWFRYP